MIKIEGDQEVIDILQEVTPRVAKNLVRSTVHGVAGEVRDEIKRAAPDDPATRKDDIVRTTKAKRLKQRQRGFFESAVTIGAFYWRFHEYGTVKMTERPFVLPSAERMRAKLVPTFREQFGKKLEGALKRASR